MNKLLNLAILSLSSSLTFASPLTLKGEVDVQIKTQSTLAGAPDILKFKLPAYDLSAEAKNYLREQLALYPSNSVSHVAFSSELPQKVSLGMQMTPVLNQGYHGSCVTFAVTAAINATLGAGDYISQLCSLELGSYLAIHDKIGASGWNGSLAPWVFAQISQYGIISQNYQKEHGCAGVHDYPLKDETNEGNPMSEAEFLAHSIPVTNLISWKPLMQAEEAFSAESNNNDLIFQIKAELAKGNRLAVGMMLDLEVGGAGSVGTHVTEGDTWMLTPAIISDAMAGNIYAGHEMVITGYDDNLEITDGKGNVNKGVFTLRNSWSEYAGDKGNYYVTYDYVKFLADEVIAVRLKAKSA